MDLANFPFKDVFLFLLTTTSTYLLGRVAYQKERLKNIENQLSDKKYKMYSDVIFVFFDISAGEKLGIKLSQEDLAKRFFAIKREMYLYAPDEIFRKFTDWLLNLDVHDNPTKQFNDYYELILLIRKDMGNKKTKITKDDFMLFYMQNREEYAKFKYANGW